MNERAQEKSIARAKSRRRAANRRRVNRHIVSAATGSDERPNGRYATRFGHVRDQRLLSNCTPQKTIVRYPATRATIRLPSRWKRAAAAAGGSLPTWHELLRTMPAAPRRPQPTLADATGRSLARSCYSFVQPSSLGGAVVGAARDHAIWSRSPDSVGELGHPSRGSAT